MFSLFSHIYSEGLSLVLDIQSGLVRGALVSFKKGQNPHLIHIISKPIEHKSNVDSNYLTKMMVRTVEEVCLLIAEEGITRAKEMGFNHKSVHTVHYVLSSPWVISQSKTVKICYGKETEVTEPLIKTIVDRERTSFVSQYKEGNISEEYEFDLAFIEQKIFDVKLNGYSVVDYKGKKVQDLEISFAVTLSSKRILDRIQNAVSKTFIAKNEAYHSALLLHYVALRSLIDGHDEYISIHVHGELTDIVIVKKGISSYLASFPFGTITVLRKLRTSLKNSEETSDSLLSMFQDGKLEEAEERRVSKALAPILSGWQAECLATLRNIGEKVLLPRLAYLSTHSHYEIFKNILTATQFEILAFDNSVVDNVVTFEKSSERSTLMGMYTFALKDVL